MGIPLGQGSPFSAYIPHVNGPDVDAADQAEWNRAAKERHSRIEAGVSECMARRGFDYFPVEWVEETPERLFPNGDVMWLPRLPEDRSEAERVGYGVQPPAGLAGGMGESSPKNIEYQASLSDEAAREYDLALHGPNPYESSDALADESCLGQAVTANPADGPGASLSPADQFAAQFWDLGRAMDDLVFSGVRADQAVIEANAAWALCMDAKGYDLASGNLYSADQVEPWTAHTLALRTKADGSLGDAWYNYSSDDATPEDERSLGGWPAEIAIAVDDFDCRHDTDYETVYRDVQLRLEEEFVEYNKDRLDMMVAYVTGIG